MRVLVACERSGVVRRAFRKLGHHAVSCDLVPADDGSSFHIQNDVLQVIATSAPFDLMIAHPPCTYLCNSGVCWLFHLCGRTRVRVRKPDRWNKLEEARQFFMQLWETDIPRICIENPIPHHHAALPDYDQIIQPYMFGHPESKATCLWLKGLPKLVETNNVKAQWKALPKAQAQRLHWLGPNKDRARLRSETYSGVGAAMAEQWGNL